MSVACGLGVRPQLATSNPERAFLWFQRARAGRNVCDGWITLEARQTLLLGSLDTRSVVSRFGGRTFGTSVGFRAAKADPGWPCQLRIGRILSAGESEWVISTRSSHSRVLSPNGSKPRNTCRPSRVVRCLVGRRYLKNEGIPQLGPADAGLWT
jgi:hypothetical protein